MAPYPHRLRPKHLSSTQDLLTPLSLEWFRRPTAQAARGLVGRLLICRSTNGLWYIDLITQTEAYLGPEDAASHARFGVTPRSRLMYETTGHWYLYLVYGMHILANITTDARTAGGVLLRETAHGQGPARLVQALRLTFEEHHGKPLGEESGAWVSAFRLTPRKIHAQPRIGIAYATSEWREAPLRFVGEWKRDPKHLLEELLQQYAVPQHLPLGHPPLSSRGQ